MGKRFTPFIFVNANSEVTKQQTLINKLSKRFTRASGYGSLFSAGPVVEDVHLCRNIITISDAVPLII